jgi:hypothetical protein
MYGIKTNVVTNVEIHDRAASDTKILPSLVETTAAHFDMLEVSADKGYSSVNNVDVIATHGGTPYIAFKNIHSGAAGGLWEKMFHTTTAFAGMSSCVTITSAPTTKAPSA